MHSKDIRNALLKFNEDAFLTKCATQKNRCQMYFESSSRT